MVPVGNSTDRGGANQATPAGGPQSPDLRAGRENGGFFRLPPIDQVWPSTHDYPASGQSIPIYPSTGIDQARLPAFEQ
jgi:hypothetical protein